MKKGDLIDEVSKVVKTKKDAQAAEDCVLPSITKVLEKGDVLASRRTHLAALGGARGRTTLTNYNKSKKGLKQALKSS